MSLLPLSHPSSGHSHSSPSPPSSPHSLPTSSSISSSSSHSQKSKSLSQRYLQIAFRLKRYWITRSLRARVILLVVLFSLLLIAYYTIATVFHTSSFLFSLVSSQPLHIQPLSTDAQLSLSTTPVNSTDLIDLSSPLSRQTMGHCVWSFLHQLAAMYPESPSSTHREAALNFLQSLPILYPCKMCAHHFSIYLKSHPPRVNSRKDLSEWLCEAHNSANERLEKPIMDCTKIAQKWPDELKNSCGCSDEEGEEGKEGKEGQGQQLENEKMQAETDERKQLHKNTD